MKGGYYLTRSLNCVEFFGKKKEKEKTCLHHPTANQINNEDTILTMIPIL